jgi:very-short-patch-repair endonuclease
VVIGPVLAQAGLVVTTRVRDRAAQLAVPGSVLAGPSAARIWDIPVPDGRTWLAVDPDRHPRLPDVEFVRTSIDSFDVGSTEDGSRMTGRERTVFDCLRLLPDAAGAELLDRALQRRWITLDDLAGRVSGYAGRRGCRRLIRLLRRAADGTQAASERLLARLLIGARIGGWSANQLIFDVHGLIGLGDMVFEAARLVIELDGWAYHTTPDRFQRDRARQNRLVAAGWTVLRFTWRDLTERPAYVIATIRAMLARLAGPAI